MKTSLLFMALAISTASLSHASQVCYSDGLVNGKSLPKALIEINNANTPKQKVDFYVATTPSGQQGMVHNYLCESSALSVNNCRCAWQYVNPDSLSLNCSEKVINISVLEQGTHIYELDWNNAHRAGRIQLSPEKLSLCHEYFLK